MARRRSFSTERGSTTVEGLMVISLFAIFLTLMPFTYRLFAAWYEIQSQTREQALTTASKGCGGGGGARDPVEVGGSLEDTRRVVNERGDQGEQKALDTSLSNVSATKERGVGFGRFSATVKAKSFGSCNERAHETSMQGWTEFGFDKHQGGS